jgi:hypothetical protein
MHIGFFSYRKPQASEFVGGKRREAGMALNSDLSFNIPHKCTKIVIKVGEWEGKLEDGSQETGAGLGTASWPSVLEPSAARNMGCILKYRRYAVALNPESFIDAIKKAGQFWWSP